MACKLEHGVTGQTMRVIDVVNVTRVLFNNVCNFAPYREVQVILLDFINLNRLITVIVTRA